MWEGVQFHRKLLKRPVNDSKEAAARDQGPVEWTDSGAAATESAMKQRTYLFAVKQAD